MQKVTKCLILSARSYYVFTPQGFVMKFFLIFIVDEEKNFAANNIFFKLLGISHVLGSVHHWWRSYTREFRGFKAVEGFCCKFIYCDCRVQGQRLCIRSKTSLYYSGFLFGKVSPQVFYCETSLFFWFSQVIISCPIYYFAVHDIDVCLF